MSTLFEIRDDLLALEALLAEVGGDITDAEAEAAIDAWLSETEGAVAEKVDRYAALIREMESRAAARQAEADRLAALAKTDENAAKRLKDRLLWFLQDQGLPKLDTPRFRLTVAKNGGKTPVEVLVPPESLPEAFQRIRTTYSADTDAIRAGLEMGEEIPFARLGERGVHLRIK